MADYPCDIHLARYSGPSNRAYLNVYREDLELKLKANICGDCLAELMTEWVARALHQTPGGVWDPPQPDQELEGLWMDAGERSRPLGSRGRR